MRKITKESVGAFLDRQNFSKANMLVYKTLEMSSELSETFLSLHGNDIARYDKDGYIWITDAGWGTVTTKERLNALPRVRIQQKNFKWYLNDRKWNGEWVRIERDGTWKYKKEL